MTESSPQNCSTSSSYLSVQITPLVSLTLHFIAACQGPTLLWHQLIGLERSTGLDTGGGIRGCWVCQARTSKWEDEAGALQVMVKHGHMLFPRLGCSMSSLYITTRPEAQMQWLGVINTWLTDNIINASRIKRDKTYSVCYRVDSI